MPSISIPKDFFRSERDTVYASWKTAFWRELISNSIDAGAKSISIRTNFTERGDFRVIFYDDGYGMDRDIVENIYMKLGGTTKAGTDGSVGGFGRARLLTCFSHERYSIRSRDILVLGEGAEYDIRPASQNVRGTAVSIDIEQKHALGLMRGLKTALRQSSIRIPIVMDLAAVEPGGGSIDPFDRDDVTVLEDGRKRFSAWSRKGRHFADLEDENGTWAHLHVSSGKTALPYSAVVRVDGIAMYDEHLSVPIQVTVDLVPERSRDVLTASRDSIRGSFRQELQKLFSKAAADRNSMFRERSRRPETSLTGSGEAGRSLPMPRCRKEVEDTMAIRETSEHGPVPDRTPFMTIPNAAPAQPISRSRELGLRLPVAVFVDNPSSAQRSAISRYRPETWLSPGGNGRNAELLHAAWTGACRYMLETLYKTHGDDLGDMGEWVTGFVFDGSTMGLHKSLEDIPHGLLFNPVDADGRQRFKVSDPVSMKRLGALAAHEVAHCVHDWHDESYASLLTDLMAESSDRALLKEMSFEMGMTRDWQRLREELLEIECEKIIEDNIAGPT